MFARNANLHIYYSVQIKISVKIKLFFPKHKVTSHTAPHTANYARTAQNATKVTMEH